MTHLTSLWLPILLSAVGVFIMSSLLNTVIPWHKNDFKGVPNEDDAMIKMRAMAIPPGDYMMPRCESMEQMKTQAWKDKLKAGPVIFMTVLPTGETGMTKQLVGWFVYLIVLAGFVGCITSTILPPGGDSHDVFHYTASISALAYVMALWQMSIWYNRSWMTTIRSSIDGLIYAAITGGAFVYFWPK